MKADRRNVRSWSLTLLVLSVVLTACSRPDAGASNERLSEVTQALGAAPVVTSFAPARAAQGASVTLTGSGFTGTTAVAFGGTAASVFSVVSDTAITATVPAGAPSGQVSVTTALEVGTSSGVFKVSPTVSSFSPLTGAAGTVVVLTGTGLSGTTAVTIAGTASSFSTPSDTEVDVTVPPGVGNGKITVTTSGGSVTSAQSFAGGAPTISSITAQGKQGATVTINGTGFANVTSVTFGGVAAASVTVVSTLQIKAVVPSGAPSGPIVVTTALGSAASGTAFSVVPTVGSFSPTNGAPGTVVSVTGTGLQQASSVAFGGVATSAVAVSSDTQISATVPAGAVTGKVTVTTTGGSATSAGTFTLQAAPAITSLAPASAAQGATVRITGTNFLGVTAVAFSGVAAVINASTATTVTVVVPVGATTGPVTVSNAAGTGATATPYPVLPKVSSVLPTSGAVGDSVSILGSAFTGASSVTFGGAVAVFSVVSDGTISATVPTGAITGKVVVTTAGGTATSASNFQIVVAPPAITSFSPAAGIPGTKVTLHGTGFGGVSNVAFNGTAAATFTVTSATAITAIVPAGATTGAISVANQDGAATSANAFTVQAFPEPLPAPPLYVDTAPATLSVGGIDFIDPNNVLSGLTIKVSSVAGDPTALLGADSILQIKPSGPLTGVVYARLPNTLFLGSSAGALLWTRPETAGPFHVAAAARVGGGGQFVSVAMSSFGQDVVLPLSYRNDGALSTLGAPFSLASARAEGNLSFSNVSDMSMFGVRDFLVNSVGFAQPLDGLPTVNSSPVHNGGPREVFFVRTFDDFGIENPGSTAGLFASSSGDEVLVISGSLQLNGTTIAADGTQPSISADGKTITYSSNGQIQEWHGSTSTLSLTPSGNSGGGPSYSSVVAQGGRYVSFRSDAPDLDPLNSTSGVYFRDLTSPGLRHLTYPSPLALVADCSSGGCVAGQIPFAISDGGRYVFLEDDAGTDPLPPRTSALSHDLTYALQPCRNAYRYDRATSQLAAVAYGDWFAVDRGGRSIASHPCRPNDNFGGDPLNLSGFVLRDIAVGAEVEVDPDSQNVSALAARTYGGPSDFQFEFALLASGAMSGDGNTAYYVIDGFTSETYTWQAWGTALPSLVSPPTVTVNAGQEYTPITVNYAGMAGETTGDLLALVDGTGRIIDAYLTNGQKSGSFQWNGVAAGTYAIDAYDALAADPPVLKRVSRTPVTVAGHTAVLSIVNGGACEYEPFSVQFSNFLALSPEDRVVLGTIDGSGNVTPLDTQAANGQASGTLRFNDRLAAGENYVLQVYYGTPGDPGNLNLDLTLPLTSSVCLDKLVSGITSPAPEACRFVDVNGDLAAAPQSRSDVAISPDGSQVAYLTGTELHLYDHHLNQDELLAISVHGFGASQSALFLAYAVGPDIIVLNTSTRLVTTVPAQLDPNEQVSVSISDDGFTVAFTNEMSSRFTYVSVWSLLGTPTPLISDPIDFRGCFPDMTPDGHSLFYTTSTIDTNDSSNSDNFDEFRPVFVDLTNPVPQGDLPPAGVVPTGDIGFGIQADAELVRPRVDGTEVAFATTLDPFSVPGWVVNPPSQDPGNGLSYLITQGVGGDQRTYVSTIANSVFFIQGTGDLFFSTAGLGAGLWWQGTGQPSQVFPGTNVTAIRPAFGLERRVAFIGTVISETQPAVWIAPY